MIKGDFDQQEQFELLRRGFEENKKIDGLQLIYLLFDFVRK